MNLYSFIFINFATLETRIIVNKSIAVLFCFPSITVFIKGKEEKESGHILILLDHFYVKSVKILFGLRPVANFSN